LLALGIPVGDVDNIIAGAALLSDVLLPEEANTYLNTNAILSLFVPPITTTALNSLVAVIVKLAVDVFAYPAFVPSAPTKYISKVVSEREEVTV
jgi:hypothetical protein